MKIQNDKNRVNIKTEIEHKYCLYARKSTEAEDKQALSIESQVKEMLSLADREGLNIVEIKREAHSSKEVGQRPIFNEMINDLHQQKYKYLLIHRFSAK
jgi:DNA invertase Pin-like site-specific DNA recombinase